MLVEVETDVDVVGTVDVVEVEVDVEVDVGVVELVEVVTVVVELVDVLVAIDGCTSGAKSPPVPIPKLIPLLKSVYGRLVSPIRSPFISIPE